MPTPVTDQDGSLFSSFFCAASNYLIVPVETDGYTLSIQVST